MHDNLSRALHPVVYHVTSHLTPEKRAKMLSACKSNDPGVLLDGSNSAAISHHFSLVLSEGDHFDLVRRGLALAAAGRYASVSSDSAGATLDASRRNSAFLEFRDH
jgi:hypothetical protein